MIALAGLLLRSSGWARALLLATSTAFVSGLLLVVVALLRLPAQPRELLFDVVADPGTRYGAALAGVLVTLPALLLLYQAVRLGSATRDRRLAALRVVGATTREVRLLGALEVGVPSAAGSLLGVAFFGLLRLLFGGQRTDYGQFRSRFHILHLVPTSVGPRWWEAALVVGAVAAFGTLVGWRVSSDVRTSPLGVTRRQPGRAPRPWGALLVFVAAIAAAYSIAAQVLGEAVILTCVAVAVLGVMSLASWVGYRLALRVEARTASAPLLLAARRIVAEPRATGRAAAAVGAISLVAGGIAGVVSDLLRYGMVESFFVLSLLLVATLLLVGLVFLTATMAVHSVESLLERRRQTAALVALGTPTEQLERSQRYEAALVAMPMAALGVLLGGASYGAVLGAVGEGVGAGLLTLLVVTLVVLAVTLGLVWLAIVIAVRAVRPWFLQATDAANLRTE